MTNRTTVRHQRLLTLLIFSIVTIIAVGAFFLARALGCDMRQTTAVTLAITSMALFTLMTTR